MKPGDRIRAKEMPEYEGTIMSIEEDRINVRLDKPIKGTKMTSGFIPKSEFDAIFELIEKSDWASLWDDAAEDQ